MGELMPASGWYAAVEGVHGSTAPEEDWTTLRYARVIAWERVDEEGQPALRAWVNGKPPIASDNWTMKSYFINHFTMEIPDNARWINFA